ncbi:hypothetical protein [Nonomuraea lactucae]|uniref:hypothetical protein n=1 Tax=Nonomuraea lactucae TaxID=2249762 RepID=UPI000DE52889|nr:hypothetical protein [Nonomuraea lactucae]
MLKRLLITAAVAGSTLVVTGPITSQAANAAPTYAPASQPVVTAQTTEANARCRWRKRHGRWCFYCWRHGEWERIFCRWQDDDDF